MEDIFSKGRVRKEKKVKVIVDTREKNSLVASYLFEKSVEVVFEKLDIGDYVAGDVVVERKAFSDLIGSMMNKRLQRQLVNLKKYEKGLLLIEGFDFNYSGRGIHENAIRGLLISIAVDYQIPVVYSFDEEDSADFLILLAKRKKGILGIRHFRDLMNLDEQKRFVLEGFPGIGPRTAERLLEKFGSLKRVFEADEKELEGIERFDEKKRKRFREVLEK